MLRTHNCGELNSSNIKERVVLSGWVNNRRDLGSLIFIDLRDRYGLTQLSFNSDTGSAEISKILKDLRNEWVIQVEGTVLARSDENKNLNMATGEIEVVVDKVLILNKSLPLPFEVNDAKKQDVNESLRFKYRFLDLRSSKSQKMLKVRDEIIIYTRNYFHNLGFIEVQTPILANSSPEGARDFLIPARMYPGKFYALPQAPQQYKQLLMVGGVDRYFQIAPCFRDEDPRMDRHYGEFYQIDMEMSFVEQEDIFQVTEPLVVGITNNFTDKKIVNLDKNGRFVQISWTDSMNRFGSDKPDLRFSMEIKDISEIVKDSGFSVFADQLSSGGVVRAIKAENGASFSRKEIDEVIELAKKRGLLGLSYIIKKDDEIKTSLSKFLDSKVIDEIIKCCDLKNNDILFIAADKWKNACQALGQVRIHLADKLGLKDNNTVAFAWIVDFPMYEYSEIEEGRIDFGHNPFSMPQGGMKALEEQEPLSILAYQFDLVLNGFEASSGAIRNHDPEIMYKAFEVAGYSKQEVDDKFSAMINAFSYGAPPHGGNAPGLDRILMALFDCESIRDVYAFPKDSQGKDLLSNSPNSVYKKQLDDLNIEIKGDEK